ALTMQRRLAFGDTLALVERAGRYNLSSLDMSRGEWNNDIFPAVFATSADDVIQKWTYEPSYQQVLTSSDPRFTASADPRALESADYARTLLRRTYTGPAGDPNRLLAAVHYPDATQPDGMQVTGISETFDAYDTHGRILQLTDI